MKISKTGARYLVALVILVVLGGVVLLITQRSLRLSEQNTSHARLNGETIALPVPNTEEGVSFEQVLSSRRSHRSFSAEAISFEDLSQILWAAQGISDDEQQLRTAPSAGGLYPTIIFVYAHNVKDFDQGIYAYEPSSHTLILLNEGDFSNEIYSAGLSQSAFSHSATTLLVAADYAITQERYGDRTERYVHMEAGHIGQNICLQATALDLGTVPIGAFEDERIQNIFLTGERYTPLYLFPIGVIN